jgi:hypothetical protein
MSQDLLLLFRLGSKLSRAEAEAYQIEQSGGYDGCWQSRDVDRGL